MSEYPCALCGKPLNLSRYVWVVRGGRPRMACRPGEHRA